MENLHFNWQSHAPGGTVRGSVQILAGDHIEFDHLKYRSKDVLPYVWLENLGHGGSASVEKVQDVHTGSLYARKVFQNISSRNLNFAKKDIENEVRIMRRLAAHHHIVKVHATYIFKCELAILLDPVADGGDLASFLEDYREANYTENTPNLWQNEILWQAFGCLASGIAFMHKEKVRHKDIKPHNVLIHGSKMIFADFGLSHYFGDTDQSTTVGLMNGFTRRYCAPEALDGSRRNTKTELFSLGCVFIEMFAALCPSMVREELLEGPFGERLASLSSRGYTLWEGSLSERRSGFDFKHALIKASINRLVKEEPTARPHACELAIDFCEAGLACAECLSDSAQEVLHAESPRLDGASRRPIPLIPVSL